MLKPLAFLLLSGCAAPPAQITVHPQGEPVQIVLPNCRWNCEAAVEITTDNEGTITAGGQQTGSITESTSTMLPGMGPVPLPLP
jgi:hypothetical protein